MTPDGRDLGFGLQVGAPTAFVAKAMFNRNVGVSAGIGAFAPWVFGPTPRRHTLSSATATRRVRSRSLRRFACRWV